MQYKLISYQKIKSLFRIITKNSKGTLYNIPKPDEDELYNHEFMEIDRNNE